MTTETAPSTTTTTELAFDINTLPEELRGEQTLSKFKTWGDVAKSYVNLEKTMGAGKDHLFRIPKTGDIPPEVWKQLGKPDKYEFPAELKTTLPDDYKAALVEKANKLNMTKQQFEELLIFTDEQTVTRTAAAQADAVKRRTAAQDALKAKLGAAYDQNVNLAKDVSENIFKKPELWKKFEESGLAHDADFIDMMSEIGRLGGEDRIITGKSSGAFVMTPAQAKAEVSTLRADKPFMTSWTNRSAPDHKEAVERMSRLQQLANQG